VCSSITRIISAEKKMVSLTSVAAVGAAVSTLAVLFVQYAMHKCHTFPIDFSQTKGKIIVITGANSGLGFETALVLAKHNATIVLACRNMGKCEEAKKKILSSYGYANLDTMKLDLASFDSIRHFSNEFSEKYDHLDVLINNAGVMALPAREVTADGLEFQLGTNHFGHFLLTALLYPKLSQHSRIINHSSGAHAMSASTFPLDNMQLESKYDPWVAYGNSKLANLMFTYELHERLQKAGNPKQILTIAVHPGFTATNLQNEKFPFWEQISNFFAMKGPDGAKSQIYG
jgi:NAD(P)-dependent dehydrogenase (short-subunit alcohol dehydrogenase family)